jgi:rhodanese-related sulfurtransferase
MGFFSFLGFGPGKITEVIRRGAIIIDVRHAGAFDQGKVPDSINIPLDRIPINIERIRSMNRPIVLCCAYGSDCANAARILKENGIKEVYNGGRWDALWRKIR